jgi:uncharacterized membrane protein YbhN (UPF0104 family)
VDPDPEPLPGPRAPRRRAARLGRTAFYAVGVVLAGLAVWSVSGRSDEFLGVRAYLGRLRWDWVLAALGAEVASFVAFAGVQRRLLRAGRVRAPLLSMTALTAAGTAIQNSLPGGVVLTTAFVFRRYRRYGADDMLAGWVIVAVAAVSFVSLALIGAIGVVLALGSASAVGPAVLVAAVVVVAAGLGAAWVKRDRWLLRCAGMLRLTQRVVRRPRGDADHLVRHWLDQLGLIHPNRRDWALALLLATANWLLDIACLALAFHAVGASVPWHGLLIAYGAGQLASLLPITPGGLGLVEGSLTVALVAFGGVEASAVAAVLVYRVVSFWLVLPVGWGSWAMIGLSGRRRSRMERLVA